MYVQVDGDGKFERVSGTSVGGGTFWGLGKLLTKCKRLAEYNHQNYFYIIMSNKLMKDDSFYNVYFAIALMLCWR